MNQSIYDYSSPRFLARLVVIALAVGVLVDLVSMWSGWMEIGLLERIGGAGPFTQEEADANDLRQIIIWFVHVTLYAATAVLFLVWFHRANKNLTALGGADRRFTPGWAVGWWFIPLMNVLLPYKVAAEIWRASDPGTTDRSAWKDAPGSFLIGAWWVSWLAAGVATQVSVRLSLEQRDDIGFLVRVDYSAIAADSITLVAAILCILVVNGITRRQEDKHKVVTAMGLNVVDRAQSTPPPLPPRAANKPSM